MMGRRSLRDTERHGRSGDSCGGGGVGGLHGEPVSELLDTSEEPALDGGAVEERAGDVEDSSCVLAAAVQPNEVSKRRGRNGDSCGGGGASGLHGECVLELLDALEAQRQTAAPSRRNGPATERTPAVPLLLKCCSTCAMVWPYAEMKQWLAMRCLNGVQCAARRG